MPRAFTVFRIDLNTRLNEVVETLPDATSAHELAAQLQADETELDVYYSAYAQRAQNNRLVGPPDAQHNALERE